MNTIHSFFGKMNKKTIDHATLLIAFLTLFLTITYNFTDVTRQKMASASYMARCGSCNNTETYKIVDKIDHMLLENKPNYTQALEYVEIINQDCSYCRDNICRHCLLSPLSNSFDKIIFKGILDSVIPIIIILLVGFFLKKRLEIISTTPHSWR